MLIDVHRAAANDFGFTNPRKPPLQCNVLLYPEQFAEHVLMFRLRPVSRQLDAVSCGCRSLPNAVLHQ